MGDSNFIAAPVEVGGGQANSVHYADVHVSEVTWSYDSATGTLTVRYKTLQGGGLNVASGTMAVWYVSTM